MGYWNIHGEKQQIPKFQRFPSFMDVPSRVQHFVTSRVRTAHRSDVMATLAYEGKGLQQATQFHGLSWLVAGMPTLWKIWKSVGMIIPNKCGKIKNVPNHQSDGLSPFSPQLPLGIPIRQNHINWAATVNIASIGWQWLTMADMVGLFDEMLIVSLWSYWHVLTVRTYWGLTFKNICQFLTRNILWKLRPSNLASFLQDILLIFNTNPNI